MLVKYKKQANIAAGFWLVSLVCLLAFLPFSGNNIWEPENITGILLMLISMIFMGTTWFAFWAYAKAKGYSGFLGLVLPLFSVIGLAILAALRDKHPESSVSTDVNRK